MKRLGLWLMALALSAAMCSCDGQNSTNTASSMADEMSVEKQEYSGTLYTTRAGDDVDYIIKHYTENGVLVKAQKYVAGVISAENSYYADGTLKASTFYNDEGAADYTATYTLKDNVLTELDYNLDGSYKGKFTYRYNKNACLDYMFEYDANDVKMFEMYYYYDESGRLEREDGTLYDGTLKNSYYMNYYDDNGQIYKNEQIIFDEKGNIAYQEFYNVIDGDYILISKTDGEGNPLPLE